MTHHEIANAIYLFVFVALSGTSAALFMEARKTRSLMPAYLGGSLAALAVWLIVFHVIATIYALS